MLTVLCSLSDLSYKFIYTYIILLCHKQGPPNILFFGLLFSLDSRP